MPRPGVTARHAVPGVVRFLSQLSPPPVEGARVALTFDDGPHETHTPAVLDVLAAHDAPAAFFVIGEHAEHAPDVLRAVAAGGHTIGCHGWTHTKFTELSPAALDEELDHCLAHFDAVLQAVPRYVRPPYGTVDADVATHLRSRGLVPVCWSIDPQDWRLHEPEVITQHVFDELRPDRILLLHDGMSDATRMVAALPEILDGIRDRGYELTAL